MFVENWSSRKDLDDILKTCGRLTHFQYHLVLVCISFDMSSVISVFVRMMVRNYFTYDFASLRTLIFGAYHVLPCTGAKCLGFNAPE